METKTFPPAKINSLMNEANELTAIFVSCLRTSKGLSDSK